jgi:pimeloyl-ACP methyl ester carboxylesterase
MPKQSAQPMAKREIEVHGKGYTVAYEKLHPEHSQTVLFLHGWGANKEIMKKAFAKTFEGFGHLYVDLPGFGGSSLKAPMNSKGYSEVLGAWLEALHIKPVCIVGHSFGGKLATLLNPPMLVLLSSAGIVPPKPLLVRAKISLFKGLKALGLGRFYSIFATKDIQGMPPVMYETLKRVVDEDMRDAFKAYDGKAWIFWGEDDKATPLRSGEAIAELISDAAFHPLKGDHFFFLLHAQYIGNVVRSEAC